MARATPLHFLSFRRTFTLLVLLVVVPSAALSGFGVLAIINERAAVEKRLEAVWSGRLEDAVRALRAQLSLASVTVDGDTVRVRTSDGVELTEASFVWDGSELRSNDPRLKAALEPLAGELVALPGRPIVFSVSSAQSSFVVAALREDGRSFGASLSEKKLQALLASASADLVPPGEPVAFELKPVKRETTPEGVVGRIVSGVADVRQAALGAPRELASYPLPSPLQDYRVVAVATGEDPVAKRSARNRAVYAALLVLFYGTLAVGVVFTGRALYREAKLSRLKTDFVSLVSHELRTPLTSIRMFIETLALGRVRDAAQTQEVLGLLSQETQRLSEMIERVLDWARLESGRTTYKKESVSVESLVDAAVSAFRAQRLDAQVELSSHVEGDLPFIEVDREAVSGALLNLMQNAFKYTGENKRIQVRARLDRRGIAIDVEDNGVGIAPKERRRIFDRFYRVDNLLTRSSEGSGLGLSIAKRIVEAHGGRITVASTVGQGSVFTLHLPPARERPVGPHDA